MKNSYLSLNFYYLGSANLWTAVGWVGSSWVEGISMPSSKVSGNMAARTLWDLVWFNCWFISKKRRINLVLKQQKNQQWTNITFVFLLNRVVQIYFKQKLYVPKISKIQNSWNCGILWGKVILHKNPSNQSVSINCRVRTTE